MGEGWRAGGLRLLTPTRRPAIPGCDAWMSLQRLAARCATALSTVSLEQSLADRARSCKAGLLRRGRGRSSGGYSSAARGALHSRSTALATDARASTRLAVVARRRRRWVGRRPEGTRAWRSARGMRYQANRSGGLGSSGSAMTRCSQPNRGLRRALRLCGPTTFGPCVCWRRYGIGRPCGLWRERAAAAEGECSTSYRCLGRVSSI